jgi:hypothetical protein
MGFLSGVVDAVGGAVKSVGKAVGGAVKEVGKFVGGVAEKVGDVVSGVEKSVGKFAMDVLKSDVFKIATTVMSFIPGLNVAGWAGKALSLLSTASSIQGWISSGLKVFEGLKNGKGLGEAVLGFVADKFPPLGMVGNVLGGALTPLKQVFSFAETLQQNLGVFQGGGELINNFLRSPVFAPMLPTSIASDFIKQQLGAVTNPVMQQITNAAQTLQGLPTSFASNFFDGLGVIPGVNDAFIRTATDVAPQMRSISGMYQELLRQIAPPAYEGPMQIFRA